MIEPFVIVPVAVAVVPIPMLMYPGLAILIGTVLPVYPEPTLVISRDDIVPAADTIAVNAADTGSLLGITNAPVSYTHLTLPTKA